MDSSPLIEVLIWEPRPIVRAGMRAILGTDRSIAVVEASTIDAVFDETRHVQTSPKVLLVSEENFDKVESVPHKLVLLADQLAGPRLAFLLAKDVFAIVSTRDSHDEMICAVQSAWGDALYLSKSFLPLLKATLPTVPLPRVSAEPTAFDKLTARENDVLDLLIRGVTNKEIADALHITEKTVKFHVSNILMKTGFNSRARLIAEARHQQSVGA